ncbi:MAG: RHS repeat-associated core domain-containing protein [Patescibacteria group bacterium]
MNQSFSRERQGRNLTNVIVGLLILSLVFSSPLLTFAQSVDEAPSQAPVETPTNSPAVDTNTIPLDTSEIQNAIEYNNNNQEAALTESAEDSPQSLEAEEDQNIIALPDDELQPDSLLSDTETGVDRFRDPSANVIKNQISRNLAGALNYSYPIEVPPGRTQATTPNLELQYSSSPDLANVFGYGWSVNIPYIERVGKRGTDKLYTGTDFNSSLTGELASTSATTYISKIDNGDFLNYTFQNNIWTVTDKSGNQYTFGSTTAARQDNVASSTQVYKWMLEDFRDTNGNYIKYQYSKDSGQIYPSSIIYSGNNTTDGPFEVAFSRESRADVSTSTQSAFSVVTKDRINEIQTKFNGDWVRKYTLAYSTGDNTVRSILTSVTQSSRDDLLTATTTLPATTFTYSTSTLSYSQSSAFQPPISLNEAFTDPYFMNTGVTDYGLKIVDINGDGLTDILQAFGARYGGSWTVEYHAYINNGNGYTDTPSWYSPVDFMIQAQDGYRIDTGVVFEDINGDKLPDLIQSSDGTHGCGCFGSPWIEPVKKVYINTGSGFATSTDWVIPVYFVYNATQQHTRDLGVRMADVNGDDLPDILEGRTYSNGSGGTTTVKNVFINTGTGFATSTSWTLPVDFVDSWNQNRGNPYQDLGVRIVDINSDGLNDIVESSCLSNGSVYRKKAYINSGTGFVDDPTWHPALCFVTRDPATPNTYSLVNYMDEGVRFMDINGDSLVDFYKSTTNDATATSTAYLNTGKGFSLLNSWTPATSTIYASGNDRNDRATRFVDINGDGRTDVLQGRGDVYPSLRYAYLSASTTPDLLIKVQEPQGGMTSMSYKMSAQYNNATSSNPNLPLNVRTVETIATNNAFGIVGTTTYAYNGGLFYFNNAFDKKFAGFASTTETDAVGNLTKSYFHQGSTTDSSHGEYQDDASKIGKAYRIEKYDNANNLYQKIINKWDKSALSNGANFVKLTQTINSAYDGTVNHKDKAEQYIYNDAAGTLTQKIQLGEVTGSDDGTLSDTGADLFTTTITYATSSPIIIPATEIMVDQSSVKVAEVRHYYDTLSLGSVTKGNKTKIEKWKVSSSYASTTRTFNAYGLVTQELDPRSKATNYVYDIYNMYPATSTNALSQSTSYVYNYLVGKVKQVTDSNGLVNQTTYDGFGRVTEEKQPDLTTPSTLVTKATYAYTDTALQTSVHKVNYLSASSTTNSYNYYDGLGRLIQERKSAEGTNYSVSDTIYNSLGLKASQSLPYFSTGSASTTPTATTALYTRYTYDPLQRVKTVANIVGTTTNTYTPWVVHVEDPRYKAKNYYRDAYNNLIKVDEIDGVTGYATEYQYNGLGKLTKITDGLANVRNFTYDGLGRRLTAQDLHASADTTFGSTTYAYDDAGNLTQKIDANNQTVNYTYDDLNRPLTENYTGAVGTEISYGYDSCVYGVGRLCSATTTDAITQYEYNTEGLQSKETKTLNAVNYITQTQYDRQGNVTNIVYPDSSQVAYTYNTGGLLETVSRKESTDGGFTNVVTNYDYSPLGQVTAIAYQNGVQTTNTYDANELYRLRSKVTTNASSTNLQNIAYTYDAVGNITGITDTSATNGAKTAVYTYDDLNRLSSATVTASSTSGGSWYNSSWGYRVPITASSSKVLEDIKDVYVPLSSLPSGFFANAKSDSCDIRMTKADGTTELAIDLVSASTTGQLHFSTGNSLSTSSSTIFYLYYGNPSASCYASNATYGANNVYDSNTKGVWHLEQNSASTGAIVDSTSNVHHGTMYSNYSANANGTTTGKLGSAAVFDGTNDTIDVPDSSDFEGAATTIEAWAYMDTLPSVKGENEVLVTKKHGSSPWRSYAVMFSNPENRTDGNWNNSSGSTGYAGTYAGSVSANAWHYVTLRQNPSDTSSEVSVRTNASNATTYTADTDGTTYNSNDALRFGADYAGGERLDGNLDEIRIHNVARSDNYITTRYNNMNAPSTFWSVGSQTAAATSSNTSYTENYTYNILGNILTKTGAAGTYAYTGSSTGYANPHAVTAIGSDTYAYDNNGNLTSAPGITNLWDYRNRLTQSVATSTVTYAYDHANSRIKYSVASTTTSYPNKFYNTTGATTTKHIFDDRGQMIATLEGSNASTTVHYTHTDHLSGSNVITNSSGILEQLTDYYPYGNVRLDERTGAFNEQRKYAGSEFDGDTAYNYMQARYYDSNSGRFISQDSIFLNMGNENDFLSDPQQLNSYSYARNNPLKYYDPDGNQTVSAPLNAVFRFSGSASLAQSLAMADAILAGGSIAGAIVSAGPVLVGGGITAVLVYAVVTTPWTPLSQNQSTPSFSSSLSPTSLPTANSNPLLGTGTTADFGNWFNSINLSKTTITQKPGNFNDAQRDFWARNPENVQHRPNGTITGNLPNGDKINVRPQSSDGRPTIEIQKEGGGVEKIRYGNK